MRPQRFRLDLDASDHALMVAAGERFGLPRSEVVRRLLRASMDVGPALSAENAGVLAELSAQLRAVGRHLARILQAVNAGDAVGMEATEPVWRVLHERVVALDEELTRLALSSGGNLRRRAKLGPIDPAS